MSHYLFCEFTFLLFPNIMLYHLQLSQILQKHKDKCPLWSKVWEWSPCEFIYWASFNLHELYFCYIFFLMVSMLFFSFDIQCIYIYIFIYLSYYRSKIFVKYAFPAHFIYWYPCDHKTMTWFRLMLFNIDNNPKTPNWIHCRYFGT